MSRRIGRWELQPSRGQAVVGALVAALVVFAALFGFTVVSLEDEAALRDEFDPVVYVDSAWDNIRTTIDEGTVDLASILARITPDADGRARKEDLTPVAEELGLITTGEAHVYRVVTSGTVSDVDTSTSRGTLGLDVDGYEGPIAVRVYIGTRIPSDESSIRDAAGIQFGDFREQTEYGKVAAEINRRVVADLEGLDVEGLVGQPVAVTGAFTLRTFNQPLIDVSGITLVPLGIIPG
jgi:predicted lipoprotein